MGRIEVGDKEKGAALIECQARRALRWLPIRIFSPPIFVLTVLLIEAEDDLADILGKRLDGVDDDPVVADLDAGLPIEPVHGLDRRSPREDPVVVHLQRKADVARPAVGPQAGVKDVTNGDLLKCGFAVGHSGWRQYGRMASVCSLLGMFSNPNSLTAQSRHMPVFPFFLG